MQELRVGPRPAISYRRQADSRFSVLSVTSVVKIPMKRVFWIVWAIVLAVMLAGCSLALRVAMMQARGSLEDGEYRSALSKLADAESYTETVPELQAEIVYLRAEAYAGLGRKEEALGELKYLVGKFPDTSYAQLAKEKLRKLAE